MKTLGTSRIDGKHRITVPRAVMDKLNLAPAMEGEQRDFFRFAVDYKGQDHHRKVGLNDE